MSDPRPILPLVDEQIARLKWFEAFMRGRVELEQQTISGLQALLEGAPPLSERKMLWNCALEALLDGTRDELHARMEELRGLKDKMQSVGMFIVEAETCVRDLNIEFDKLESTESVDSARAATATLHKAWLDTNSVEVSAQKSLSNLFSSKEKLENEKSLKAREAFEKYYKQDLIYRRIVHQQRKSQEQFLNSIPRRIQKYGTTYWTAVCGVGKVMESFANYLRNISSTCNSSGSALWASAKNIKPLVDATSHTEAIEITYHQSIRFSPFYYQNPGSKLRSPGGQTILFGCQLELCTVGELKQIPPVLKYLLDSVCDDWSTPPPDFHLRAECWDLVNELEQAWTGVEKSDRAIISTHVPQGYLGLVIMTYFMSLPRPIVTNNDIAVIWHIPDDPISLKWNILSNDPIKLAVFRAILSCKVGLNNVLFDTDMSIALSKNGMTQTIKSLLHTLREYPGLWQSPGGIVQEENQ